MRASDVGWADWVAAGSALLAALILVMHLVRRPPLGRSRLWLLLGLGVFPITTAGSANVAGFKATQTREFCGSCHVMEPHAADSNLTANANANPALAAIHAQNHSFGKENCYTCHKDYGMYGYVMTKAGGMRHVWLYLTEYHDMPLEKSKHDIRIRAPVPNENCMYCHTTTAPRWLSIGDHASSLEAVRANKISCASPGCHGFAHPSTKLGKELLMDGGLPQ